MPVTSPPAAAAKRSSAAAASSAVSGVPGSAAETRIRVAAGSPTVTRSCGVRAAAGETGFAARAFGFAGAFALCFDAGRVAGFDVARGLGFCAGGAGVAELGGVRAGVLESLAGAGEGAAAGGDVSAAGAVRAGVGESTGRRAGAADAVTGASGVGTAVGAGRCGAVAGSVALRTSGALSVRESVGGASGVGVEAALTAGASASAATQTPISVPPRRSVDRRDDVPLDICPSLFADSRYAGPLDRSNPCTGRAAPSCRGGRP